jgi:2-polyprenyl-6-methoxyphenol hydroxylase-like FAD-dependent oxidoreductase
VQAQEGERMIVGVLGRGADAVVPHDFAGVLACAERLPHPGAFELIRDAEPLTPVARFGFPSSVQRHYERLTRVPDGFVCIGDAICSFNPIWGQGMSVAALEVVALAELLKERASQRASVPDSQSAGYPGLAPAFYAAAARVVAVAWQLSVVPDYAFETTRGERPPGFSAGRGFMRALAKLAMQEPEVRALTNEVFHLVKPLDALRAPALVAKVLPLLNKASGPA